jgi:uncharacterized NAD(P)/FAD-binding protein YdhS
MPQYRVAVVGAGFCGTMVAVHLSRRMPGIAMALIEGSPGKGRGLAYGTVDSDHLLNVWADQMGAFSEDHGHFLRWLRTHHPLVDVADQGFAPRRLYGQYLAELLAHSQAANPQLETVHQRIASLRRLPEGFALVSVDGTVLTAEYVVLALGNFPPDQHSSRPDAMNPYAPATWDTLAGNDDVLIVGTGLTSLDLVVTLAKTKPAGTIHLLSRHGLLPREHVEILPYTLKLKPPYPDTVRRLLHALREEISTAPEVPWQSVFDALRPLNQQLWQSLGMDEKRRFMRHARAYWDVHRHRCAPKVMDAYRTLERAGRLVLHHGSIVQQTAQENGWDVVWRPRGTSLSERFTVRHVVRCTGPQADFSRLGDPLVQNLLKADLIAPDALRMGIATSQGYVACDSGGQAVAGLYALGSLLKGKLYESIAVPELRGQAEDVAALLAQQMQPLRQSSP